MTNQTEGPTYTPIEFPARRALETLSIDLRQMEVAIAVLEFIRSDLNKRLKTDRVEVIVMEYSGKYPACRRDRAGLRAQLPAPLHG
jgi:hypothetical protein